MRYILILWLVSLLSCTTKPQPESKLDADTERRDLSEAFKSYWYNGEAELTSYDLEYYRYGEKRQGKAMMIFVTEPFLPQKQVKSNSSTEHSISVMKLNATKSFNTGIYPYSIMQSAFVPLDYEKPILKISSSIQEWCGQQYAQLNHRGDFKVQSHSYFEGKADSVFKIEPELSENELWTLLRIHPKGIKLGKQHILPDFSYLQLHHKEFKTYPALLEQTENKFLTTSLTYSELGRKLVIYQEKKFPYSIEKWEEIQFSETDTLISSATKMIQLRSQYWKQNSNNYLHLRDTLNL
jgi:hypothetical protein